MTDMQGSMQNETGWKIPLVLALIVHVTALSLAMLSPAFLGRNPAILEIQTVELFNVLESLPKSVQHLAPAVPKIEPASPPAAPPVKAKPVAPPAKPVHEATAKMAPAKASPSLPKEIISYNPVKQKEAALKKIEERVQDRFRNEQLLKSRLEQLNAQNNQQAAQEKAREAAQNAINKLKDLYRQNNPVKSGMEAKPLPGQSENSVGSTVNKKLDDQQVTYWTSVLMHIQNFWTLPDLQHWDKDLEAVYVIQVRRNGGINKKYFERKSESLYFNAFVEKAVKDADPLPAFPLSFKDNEMEIGLIFHPAGLL
jgi:type IV secretory pathway VirB10-like protein